MLNHYYGRNQFKDRSAVRYSFRTNSIACALDKIISVSLSLSVTLAWRHHIPGIPPRDGDTISELYCTDGMISAAHMMCVSLQLYEVGLEVITAVIMKRVVVLVVSSAVRKNSRLHLVKN
jgi:hypothetical protein